MARAKAQPRHCIKCNILGKIYGREMCRKCWNHEYNRIERPKRPCIKCNILSEIHGQDMCNNCWWYEYRRRPTTKSRATLNSPKKKAWSQQYGQRQEVKEHRRVYQGLRCANAKIVKCPDCAQEKKVYRAGLCRYCYDNQRYGGRDNVRNINRERMQEYRNTPEYKIWAKEHNVLETTRASKRKFMRKWRKDPENKKKSQRDLRKWKYSHEEQYSISNKIRCRRNYFFRADKPVGPFDPNEILNRRLLQALQEVREGNLRLPFRRPGL
jgi:hypothetical protein